MDQPGPRRAKAARIEVERRESRLEIDVEPLASCGPRVLRREANGLRSDALALMRGVGLRVNEKGMVSSVRYHVHEAHEAHAGARGHPTKTVRTDSLPPADLGVTTKGINELDHLRVGQRTAPAVRDVVENALGLNGG